MSFNLKDLNGGIQDALVAAYDAGIIATVSAGNVPQPSTGTFCGCVIVQQA
jgi:hypothetical protein